MVKKIMIEQEDKQELLNFKTDRFNKIMTLIDEYVDEPEQEYVIGFDIAKPDSKDKSVMMQFRFVDGRYIFEGCEEI